MIWILIVAVSAVWGIIFYRIFAATQEDDIKTPSVALKYKKAESLDEYRRKDTFSLKLDYRDPMLGKVSVAHDADKEEEIIANIPVAAFVPAKPAEPVFDIEYKGYVMNTPGKKAAAIISLKGKELMLEEGQSQDGLKLMKSFRDSVRVQYMDHTKTIRLE